MCSCRVYAKPQSTPCRAGSLKSRQQPCAASNPQVRVLLATARRGKPARSGRYRGGSMRSRAGPLALVAAAALLTVSLFFGGNIGDSRLFWIGIFALAVGFGGLAAGLAGLVPLA